MAAGSIKAEASSFFRLGGRKSIPSTEAAGAATTLTRPASLALGARKARVARGGGGASALRRGRNVRAAAANFIGPQGV